LKVETIAGPVFVSYTLLQLALRQRAKVVFIATRMDEWSRVVIRLSVPGPESTAVSPTLGDFAIFMSEAQRGA
jgi:hypothetical protein